MGEHKDDEKDLDHSTPIASLSLGQSRDFYFRHQDARPPKSMKIEKGMKVGYMRGLQKVCEKRAV